MYTCPAQPTHMAAAIDIYNYKLLYGATFGGVIAQGVNHMRQINGFSNGFWGWGGEDDDTFQRVRLAGFNFSRYPSSIGRYKMHKHKHAAEKGNHENKCRWTILNAASSRWKKSGLANIKYSIEERKMYALYSHLLVDLFEKDSKEEVRKLFNCTSK